MPAKTEALSYYTGVVGLGLIPRLPFPGCRLGNLLYFSEFGLSQCTIQMEEKHFIFTGQCEN